MEFPAGSPSQRALDLTKFLLLYRSEDRQIHLLENDGQWHGRHENDAEHSYKLAMLTRYLAPIINPDLDVDKAVRYALDHDLVEVYAGDTSIWASADILDSKAAREAAAGARIAAEWPDFPNLLVSMAGYELKADPESRFVYALDKLDAILTNMKNAGAFWINSQITLAQYQARMIAVREKVALAPELLPLFDDLQGFLDNHPEYFYPGDR